MAANLTATITDLISGTDYIVDRSVTDILITGQTIARANLTVKEEFWDTDLDAVFQKEITITLNDQGQITDAGATDLIGHILFYLSDDDTAKLSPYFTYLYDIKLITNDGQYKILELGEISPLPLITEKE